MFTAQLSATGQARETPVPEAKILQDIANGFEDDDGTGDKIMQQLADMATKLWGKKLCSEKLKRLLEKYKRPENCVDIKGTKINPDIWNQLKPSKRKIDLQLSNMQQVVRKVTFATPQTTNVLLQKASGSANSKLITQSGDVISLLDHVNTQLAQFRREQIKPALKQEYSAICSAEVPLTSQYLFGDELAKQLRDARESCKISQSVGHSSHRRPYTGNQRSGHQECYNKGPERDFLTERSTQIPQKEKASDQRKEIVDQLLGIRDSVSDFTTFLPPLLSYLQDCCHNFKAGRVATHCAAWKYLTNNRVILSDVLGASTELSANPNQQRLPGHSFEEHEYSVTHQEIQKLIHGKVIMKLKYSPGQIVPGIFLLLKKDGTF